MAVAVVVLPRLVLPHCRRRCKLLGLRRQALFLVRKTIPRSASAVQPHPLFRSHEATRKRRSSSSPTRRRLLGDPYSILDLLLLLLKWSAPPLGGSNCHPRGEEQQRCHCHCSDDEHSFYRCCRLWMGPTSLIGATPTPAEAGIVAAATTATAAATSAIALPIFRSRIVPNSQFHCLGSTVGQS